MADPIWAVNLPRTPYGQALGLQHRLVAARKRGLVRDTLLLLEHPPVFTLGTSGKPEHILASPETLDSLGIEVYSVERGGDVTYHGPNQLVGYPIFDLRNYRADIVWYVRQLEETLIRTLSDFSIPARRLGDAAPGQRRDAKYIGVWVDNPDRARVPFLPDAKIAQIGVRNDNWVEYHGFALNVAPNLEHFALIIPCGITDKPVTSMAAVLGAAPEMAHVRERAAANLAEVFGVTLQEITPGELERHLQAAESKAA